MPSVIGQAIIDVRPNTDKFASSIRESIKGAAKFAAGAFAVGGAFEFFRGAAEAAIAAQENMRRLDQALEQVGQNTDKTRKQTIDFLSSLRDVSGFSREDLELSLTRAVTGLGSLKKGMAQVSLAADVARGRSISLAAAQQLVARVQSGGSATLRRLGINFQATTPHVDRLKKKIYELQQSLTGADKSQKVVIRSEIAAARQHAASAKALDKQAASTQAIALLQKRFGNATKAFSTTAAGQLAKLSNTFQGLQISIGQALLPVLVQLAQKGVEAIQWIRTLGPTVSAVSSALGPFVGLLHDLASAIGAGPIIGFIAALKGTLFVVGAVQGVTAAYAAKVEQLAKANVAEAASATASGAATEAQGALFDAAALQAQTAAAAVTEVGAASTGAAAEVGVLDVALSAIGGPIGLVAIGVAGLVGGLIYLSSQESDLSKQTKATADTFTQLGAAIKDAAAQAADFPGDKLAVQQAKLNVAEAKDAEAKAKSAVAASKAAKGTEAYRDLHHQLKQAIINTAQAENELSVARSRSRADHTRASNDLTDEIKLRQKAIKQEAALIQTTTPKARPEGRFGHLVAPSASDVQKGLVAFQAQQDKILKGLGKDTPPIIAHNIALVKQYAKSYADAFGKPPPIKGIKLILENKDAKATLKNLTKEIAGPPAPVIGQAMTGGKKLGKAVSDGIRQGLTENPFDAALVQQVKDAIDKAKIAAKIASPSQVTRDQLGKPLMQGIAQGVIQNRKLLDAALSSSFGEAVNQAKQNLSSVGGNLAGSVNAFLDARLASSAQGKALAAAQRQQADLDFQQQLKDAQTAVRATAVGTAARAKAEADLAVLVAQHAYDAEQAKVDAQKAGNERTLADLSDALNQGLISQRTYQQRVVALLKKEGVNYKAAGSALGLAFADGFVQQLRDLLKQARAIAKAGLPGTGLGSSVQDPVAGLADDIAQAKQTLNDARAAARDAGGPGKGKVTAAERAAIARDERILKALEALAKGEHKVHVDNVTVYANTKVDAKRIAAQLVNELTAAAR